MPYKSDNRGVGTLSLELSEEMSDGLDIFDYPSHDTSILHGKTIEHHLVTALNDANNIYEFVICNENHDYTYLPMTRLEGEIKVEKTGAGAGAIGADHLVAPINLMALALFRQAECELNGVQIADLTSPTYHYKSYLETVCTYGHDAAKTHLRNCLFYNDTVTKEETFTADCDSFVKRKAFLRQTNDSTFHFSIPIHIDFFDSKRFLIPGVTIKLKFIKTDDKFLLLSATDTWKLAIKNLKVSTRKLTIHPEIVAKHKEKLQHQPAIYPVTQSKIKTYIINQGISSTNLSGIFRGKLPRSLMFGFVSSDGFNGAFNKNPWFFKPYDVSYVGLTLNGVPVPASVFQPDFANGKCIREYRHFMDNTGIYHGNETNMVTFDMFKNNTAIFAYDFTPDLCNSYHNHPDSSGYVNLDLQFKNPLPENITVVVFGTFNEFVKIDASGQVTVEQ
jgi:ribonucleoside-diphosphate reductase beta chain